MDYTEMGRYANEQIQNVTNHYPYAEIPLWVVMPNHIHCLVIIHNNESAQFDVETVCTPSLHPQQTRWKNDSVNETMQNISKKRGLLSTTIGGLKRAITHYANEKGISFQWQTRFHDHIVRDWDELNRIADYIEHNPARWMQDKFYTT